MLQLFTECYNFSLNVQDGAADSMERSGYAVREERRRVICFGINSMLTSCAGITISRRVRWRAGKDQVTMAWCCSMSKRARGLRLLVNSSSSSSSRMKISSSSRAGLCPSRSKPNPVLPLHCPPLPPPSLHRLLSPRPTMPTRKSHSSGRVLSLSVTFCEMFAPHVTRHTSRLTPVAQV
jgi:hypothetical protein